MVGVADGVGGTAEGDMVVGFYVGFPGRTLRMYRNWNWRVSVV